MWWNDDATGVTRTCTCTHRERASEWERDRWIAREREWQSDEGRQKSHCLLNHAAHAHLLCAMEKLPTNNSKCSPLLMHSDFQYLVQFFVVWPTLCVVSFCHCWFNDEVSWVITVFWFVYFLFFSRVLAHRTCWCASLTCHMYEHFIWIINCFWSDVNDWFIWANKRRKMRRTHIYLMSITIFSENPSEFYTCHFLYCIADSSQSSSFAFDSFITRVDLIVKWNSCSTELCPYL